MGRTTGSGDFSGAGGTIGRTSLSTLSPQVASQVRWRWRLVPLALRLAPLALRLAPLALRLAPLALGLGLAACAGGPAGDEPGQGYYKVGKPYQVKGVWYYPKEDYTYNETGIASWYGPGFHQEKTANGEIFNQDDVTAAHKTLPMPSLVRVTNLETGKVLVVRVNDRGPFVPGRIIDLSRRSAELLGVVGRGTAQVRVSIMADESRAIAEAARSGKPASTLTWASLFGGGERSGDGARLQEGEPRPSAAPRSSVKVEETLEPQPGVNAAPPPVAVAAAAPPVIRSPDRPPPQENVRTVPGAVNPEGRFMPAPVTSQTRVKSNAHIFIQVGAFAKQENAQQLRQKLLEFGSVSVNSVTVGGGQFHRVRIGPLASVEQADDVLGRLISAGYKDNPRVVVD